MKRKWSERDEQTLRSLYGNMPVRDLAAQLRRTESSIRQRAWKISVTFPIRGQPSSERYEALGRAECERVYLDPVKFFAGVLQRPYVHARWRVWQALRDQGFSYPRIGRVTGHDHTSVLYGLNRLHGKRPKISMQAAE